jgi:hypothetical protein
MPAIVQERACRRATIVRSMLVRFPSSITGLEANLGSSVYEIEFLACRLKTSL